MVWIHPENSPTRGDVGIVVGATILPVVVEVGTANNISWSGTVPYQDGVDVPLDTVCGVDGPLRPFRKVTM